jgi:dTDP-4-dehydrorhamnose 3,5-epimerase
MAGAYRVTPEPARDDRGSFTRLCCQRELAARGLAPVTAQASLSVNRAAGTLRGMHFQAPPREEAKLLWVLRGRLFDAIVDLRRDSPTFRQSFSVELAADDPGLYVPPGLAHGFLTLEDDTRVLYFVSEFYDPTRVRGFRHDDPAVAIPWPATPAVISARDRSLPFLSELGL